VTVSIYDWNFLVDILNPVWGVESLILALICWAYLWHEFLARKNPPYLRWTVGMRVAAKISLISIGISITRLDLMYWREVQVNGPYSAWQAIVFAGGGMISCVGFLLSVRVLSVRLFGMWPWRFAVAMFFVTVIASVLWQLY
jgi:hypothetical protein